MLLTILDTETLKSRIVASPRFKEYWSEGEGSWDLERARQFGIKPVRGWPNEKVAERYLIIRADEGPTDFGFWNKNYSPSLITKALIGGTEEAEEIVELP